MSPDGANLTSFLLTSFENCMFEKTRRHPPTCPSSNISFNLFPAEAKVSGIRYPLLTEFSHVHRIFFFSVSLSAFLFRGLSGAL